MYTQRYIGIIIFSHHCIIELGKLDVWDCGILRFFVSSTQYFRHPFSIATSYDSIFYRVYDNPDG